MQYANVLQKIKPGVSWVTIHILHDTFLCTFLIMTLVKFEKQSGEEDNHNAVGRCMICYLMYFNEEPIRGEYILQVLSLASSAPVSRVWIELRAAAFLFRWKSSITG